MLRDLILRSVDRSQMKCAFVINHLKVGEVGFYNENEVVPSASLIKIHIMATVMRQVMEGGISLRQRVVVREKDKVPFSILSLLETGNSYSINDLLTLMVVQSDNTAANLLIDMVGMDGINRLIRELHLTSTVLQRKMMDFSSRDEGRDNLTTAADVARLLEPLYRGAVVNPTASAHMIEIMKKQLDKSMMRLQIPDEAIIGHKTGELERLAHDAGIVYHEKGDYIFVMFVWDAVNNLYARQSIGRISKLAYDFFTENL